jgi:hypothetical protein
MKFLVIEATEGTSQGEIEDVLRKSRLLIEQNAGAALIIMPKGWKQIDLDVEIEARHVQEMIAKLAAEREACAVECDKEAEIARHLGHSDYYAVKAAKHIRERGRPLGRKDT